MYDFDPSMYLPSPVKEPPVQVHYVKPLAPSPPPVQSTEKIVYVYVPVEKKKLEKNLEYEMRFNSNRPSNNSVELLNRHIYNVSAD